MSDYRIQGATGEWEVVIGLEVHAQVTSNAKLFSGASTAFGAEPNSQVSLVDAAMPGMLPVPNRECIRQAVRTGMAIEAQINAWSRFDRKNYFYADLPQGYQISQLYHPLVGEGSLLIEQDEKTGIPEDKVIGIERIHVEQDAGKLMHDQHPTMSYVDLNRSGVALMEIVSRPHMRSPAEAGAYVTTRWNKTDDLHPWDFSDNCVGQWMFRWSLTVAIHRRWNWWQRRRTSRPSPRTRIRVGDHGCGCGRHRALGRHWRCLDHSGGCSNRERDQERHSRDRPA